MLKSTALALLTLAALGSGAEAAERHWTITGVHGTSTADVERFCIDGECYSNVEFTGPKGRKFKTNSACTKTAPQVWECKGTVVGPNGRSHDGTITIRLD